MATNYFSIGESLIIHVQVYVSRWGSLIICTYKINMHIPYDTYVHVCMHVCNTYVLYLRVYYIYMYIHVFRCGNLVRIMYMYM